MFKTNSSNMILRVKTRDKKKVKILMNKAMTKSKKEKMVKIQNRLNNQRVIRTIINNLEKGNFQKKKQIILQQEQGD